MTKNVLGTRGGGQEQEGTGAGRVRGFPARMDNPSQGAILLLKGQLRKPGNKFPAPGRHVFSGWTGGRDLVEPIRAHGGPAQRGVPHCPAAGRLGAVALLGSTLPPKREGL